MNLEYLRKKYKVAILKIARKRGISNIRVFGSVVRNEANDESDIDFLVHANPNAGWAFFGFAPELENLLGRKVDVISDRAIHSPFSEKILSEAIPL